MAICVFESVQWTKLCWEKSWQPIIDIEDVLPQVGKIYPIEFNPYHGPSKSGTYLVLWKPPHSELNGWMDKRPFELLFSYVLEGKLSAPSSNVMVYEFEVIAKHKLTDLIEAASEDEDSPLLQINQIDGTSEIVWRRSRELRKAVVGGYTLLSGTDEAGSVYSEVLLSQNQERLCIHYSSSVFDYCTPVALITRYFLRKREQKIFEQILKTADLLEQQSYVNLPPGKVCGAEYQ